MITPVDIDTIPQSMKGKTTGNGSNIKDITDFIESGEKACVVDLRGRTVRNAGSALAQTIKKMDLPLVCIRRGDNVYIIRKDL